MNVAWPCLSFDILRDNLGEERRKYPATAFAVTGTQAEQAKTNEILVMRMSSLHKTQKDDGECSTVDVLPRMKQYLYDESNSDFHFGTTYRPQEIRIRMKTMMMKGR
jgi:hypothetical protein